MIGNKFHTV